MDKLPISVTMLVKNAEKYLFQSLQSLQACAEIIVLDNGSTDATLEIAQQFDNVRIHHHEFIGFGAMKNLAASLATHDWILNVDSDEIFPVELIDEIRQVDFSQPRQVYAMSRINHYRGKPIKTCGWYPDVVKRLYHREVVQFSNRHVHESLVIPDDVMVKQFQQPFLHYSFDGAASLISKMQHYSTLFAQQQRFRQRATMGQAMVHGVSAFLKSYVLKKGFLSGADGWVISFANACGSYYKYVKLMEENQKLGVSLIVTTYNRPDALKAVLQSVLAQTMLPEEVIIADDGSGEETRQVIEAYQRIFPVPLKHAWQEDEGFRLARSRNLALAAASQEYVVMIDGDMVLHSEFIMDHKLAAKKGVLIQGGRVILTEAKTRTLLQQPECYRQLKWYEKGLEKRLEKRLFAIHLPCLSRLIVRYEKRDWYQGIRGCNIAFFREEALQINGFNNQFIGWGREDSEFVARLFNNGAKRANLKCAAIAYHLWHREAQRATLFANDQLLADAVTHQTIRCDDGVEQV